jgi:sulfite reductase alpha subunit-like flavoprotein
MTITSFFRMMQSETAVLYVCGSGTSMGAAVDAALDNMLGETGQSPLEAKAVKKGWHEQKRYIREVWA